MFGARLTVKGWEYLMIGLCLGVWIPIGLGVGIGLGRGPALGLGFGSGLGAFGARFYSVLHHLRDMDMGWAWTVTQHAYASYAWSPPMHALWPMDMGWAWIWVLP